MNFVPRREEITADYPAGAVRDVPMHDGGLVRFSKVPEGYDPTDREAVREYLAGHKRDGAIPTGLLFLDPTVGTEMHEVSRTPKTPLAQIPFEQLCPGASALEKLQQDYR